MRTTIKNSVRFVVIQVLTKCFESSDGDGLSREMGRGNE